METIEIRQNKKLVLPMLILLIMVLLGTTYYIYLSGNFDNNNTMKILYVFLNTYLAYTIYIQAKKLIKNEPVLVLSQSGIEINEKGKGISLLWQQVIEWKTEQEKDGSTMYLIIQTAEFKKKINISWLDKRPADIEMLLQTYKSI